MIVLTEVGALGRELHVRSCLIRALAVAPCSTVTTRPSTSCVASRGPWAPEFIRQDPNPALDEVVVAAIREDVNAVAITYYQGGHVE